MNRYDWEDALVDAQTTGLIPNGALLVALKLARAINWKPKGGKPAGLYWKNEEALKAVGASRTSYFDHRQSLFDAGFFKEESGNLIPHLPESVVRTEQESQIETNDAEQSAVRTEQSAVRTEQSVVRTNESVVGTGKSVVRNPLSEDTLSEDVWSENTLSEEQETSADAPVDPIKEEVETTDLPLITLEPPSLNSVRVMMANETPEEKKLRIKGILEGASHG